MKDLKLIQTEKFGEVECDIYSNEKEMQIEPDELSEIVGRCELETTNICCAECSKNNKNCDELHK